MEMVQLVELVQCLIVNQSLFQWEAAAEVLVVDQVVHLHLAVLEEAQVVTMVVQYNLVVQEAHTEIMEHLLNLHVLLEEAAAEHVLQLLTGMVEMENKFQYQVHL